MDTPSPARAAMPRLWPAVCILAAQAFTLGIQFVPSINDGTRFIFMMAGPLGCTVLFLIWILALSRLPWRERVGAPLLAIALGAATGFLADKSMAVALWIYGAPLSLLAIVIGLRLRQDAASGARLVAVAALLLVMWSAMLLFRLEGFRGDYLPELAWRWTATTESQRASGDANVVPNAEDAAWTPKTVEWPGFRGGDRNGVAVVSGADLDWSSKPKELWRVPVGPGWSSFSQVGGRLFTQEQRGEQEAVTCLDAATGKVIWRTAFACRFEDNVSGAGPRATPTYADGKLYTLGGKAIFACLDAATGRVLWQHDLMKEVNAQLPVWGFTASPLILAQRAIVYAGGDGENGLMAFDVATGAVSWRYSAHGMNFSSAQKVTFAGQDFALFCDGSGVHALHPETGAVMWEFKPSTWKGPAICQAQQIDATSLLVPLGDGIGLARLTVTQDAGKWKVEERWLSRKFKPSFNDFVYFEGHCYGFDNNAFACIDAATGEIKWKYSGYGFGQVVLLADAKKLAVTTEKGDAVLLAVDPKERRELGRIHLIEGKTWNHPIAADGRFIMRNGVEAVAVALSSKL